MLPFAPAGEEEAAAPGSSFPVRGSSGEQQGVSMLVPAADCEDAELLPENINDDLTVGPGCVRARRTRVNGGAALTVLPGTTTKAALMAPNSSNITNAIFRYIDGVGISTRGDCNVADWCQNQFIEVAQGPLLCESTYTACP